MIFNAKKGKEKARDGEDGGGGHAAPSDGSQNGIINDLEYESLFPSNEPYEGDPSCGPSYGENGGSTYGTEYTHGYSQSQTQIHGHAQSYGLVHSHSEANIIDSLCINEIKSAEEDELFDDSKHQDKDELITKLRSKLQIKIKDYNWVMDTLIRTKEECAQRNEEVKELQKRNNQVEKECKNLKNIIERKNLESDMHYGGKGIILGTTDGGATGGPSTYARYKSEYDEVKIKLAKIEERYKEVNRKNEKLSEECNNMMKEKLKAETEFNKQMDEIKRENRNLKETNEQLKVEREKLLNKYLQSEKDNFKGIKENKAQLESLRELIQKEETMRKNAVESLNKAKEILSKSLATSEGSMKKLLEVEKDRDELKEQNDQLKKQVQKYRIKVDNLKEALTQFESMYKRIVEKNNLMFSFTHEFLNAKNCNVMILRSTNDIRHVCEKHQIDSTLFENINCFSALYTYEVIFNTPLPDSDDSAEEQDGKKRDHDKYIKIKKKKFKSLNYLLNEAQVKIIALSRSNEKMEKGYVNVRNNRMKDDMSRFVKKNYHLDPLTLQGEKTHVENLLHEKLEYIREVESKVKERDTLVQKLKDANFRIKLEKETLLKVISSISNLSSFVHVDRNDKNCSIESLVQAAVNDCAGRHFKGGCLVDDLNGKTPSNVSNNSLLQGGEPAATPSGALNLVGFCADEDACKAGRAHALAEKEEGFRQILDNLEKAIVTIENKQMSYFRRSHLLSYFDDYVITLEIFGRISEYNEEFRVEHLLEDAQVGGLSQIRHVDLATLSAELHKWKKKHSEEELLHHLEESKLIEKYRQFYHHHFIHINTIFNTIVSYNLHDMEEKYKLVYERYFNLFNLNFSNVEISFDLLLNRFERIIRLAKRYEEKVLENRKRITEMNVNEANLFERGKKLEYDLEILSKEKEKLQRLVSLNEEEIKRVINSHAVLQNECKEHKCKHDLLIEKYEEVKKEKLLIEEELSSRQIRNVKLSEQNEEMIKLYENEKAYLHSLIQEEKENNQFLREKLNSFFSLNEQIKCDYDRRLNNLNDLWVEEKEHNRKNLSDISNLKMENVNLVQRIKDLESKSSLMKKELNERIKQVNVLRHCMAVSGAAGGEEAEGGQGQQDDKDDQKDNHKDDDKDCNTISASHQGVNVTGASPFALDRGGSAYHQSIIDEIEYKAEKEVKIRKLQEGKADLEREIMQLKGEKEILMGVIETWRNFSACSKDEIRRLKKMCSDQVEKHKEFLLLSQSNEDKLRKINHLLGMEQSKHAKELDETKDKLNDQIDTLKNKVAEKELQVNKLKWNYDQLEIKIRSLESEKKDHLGMKQKEEEYIALLKNDKSTLQKELSGLLQKYQSQVEQNKKLLNEREVIITSHREEITNLKDVLENLKKENSQLNDMFRTRANLNDNQILKTRLEQMMDVNKDLQEELHEKCALRDKVNLENSELKQKLQIEKGKLLQQQKYIAELQTNLTDKNSLGNMNDEFIVSLKANLQKSRVELYNLAKEIEKVQLNEEQNMVKIKLLESQLSRRESEKKKMEQQLEEQTNEHTIHLNKIRTDLDVVNEQNRLLRLAKEENERKIEQLEKENQFFQSTKNNDSVIVEKEKLQSQVTQHLALINAKEKQIIGLNFQIKKLTNENAEMRARAAVARVAADGGVATEGATLAEASTTDMPLEIHKYISENIDLTAELENRNEVIEQCREEARQKEMEIQKLHDDIASLSRSMTKLKESLIVMEQYKDNMHRHIKEKDEIIDGLKKRNRNKLDDVLQGYTGSTSNSGFSALENAMSASSEEILTTLRNLSGKEAPDAEPSMKNGEPTSIGSEHIVIIKCNILKLFKLGSCYLYIINRNLKEIQILKNQVSSLKESIQTQNEFIQSLKTKNKNNEVIQVNNLDQIAQLKDNIQNNESSIQTLKTNLKNTEQINKLHSVNLGKYKNFIVHLIQHNVVICNIFKVVNSRKRVEPSILNQLRSLKKAFHLFMYDSIMDELQGAAPYGDSTMPKQEGGKWTNVNYDIVEEVFQNVQRFANNFNSMIERGESDFMTFHAEGDPEGGDDLVDGDLISVDLVSGHLVRGDAVNGSSNVDASSSESLQEGQPGKEHVLPSTSERSPIIDSGRSQNPVEDPNEQQNPNSEASQRGESPNMVNFDETAVDDEEAKGKGSDRGYLSGKGSHEEVEPPQGGAIIPLDKQDGSQETNNETLQRYEENILADRQSSCTSANVNRRDSSSGRGSSSGNVTGFIRGIFRGIIREKDQESKTAQEPSEAASLPGEAANVPIEDDAKSSHPSANGSVVSIEEDAAIVTTGLGSVVHSSASCGEVNGNNEQDGTILSRQENKEEVEDEGETNPELCVGEMDASPIVVDVEGEETRSHNSPNEEGAAHGEDQLAGVSTTTEELCNKGGEINPDESHGARTSEQEQPQSDELHNGKLHNGELLPDQLLREQGEPPAWTPPTTRLINELNASSGGVISPFRCHASEDNYDMGERKGMKKRKYNSDSEMVNANWATSTRHLKKLKKTAEGVSTAHSQEGEQQPEQLQQSQESDQLKQSEPPQQSQRSDEEGEHISHSSGESFHGEGSYMGDGASYPYDDEGSGEDDLNAELYTHGKEENRLLESIQGVGDVREVPNYRDTYDNADPNLLQSSQYHKGENNFTPYEEENHERESNRSCYVISSDEECEGNDDNGRGASAGLQQRGCEEEEGDEEEEDDDEDGQDDENDAMGEYQNEGYEQDEEEESEDDGENDSENDGEDANEQFEQYEDYDAAAEEEDSDQYDGGNSKDEMGEDQEDEYAQYDEYNARDPEGEEDDEQDGHSVGREPSENEPLDSSKEITDSATNPPYRHHGETSNDEGPNNDSSPSAHSDGSNEAGEEHPVMFNPSHVHMAQTDESYEENADEEGAISIPSSHENNEEVSDKQGADTEGGVEGDAEEGEQDGEEH
ncbi:hypothetical protein C922_02043 [Plasmodium inui San Antonio 1]|uniref:Uncharacterized protein n=1 Tax=Plasmodium inui San Antonio 1 TaxID=1237626 RepID=W7A291_9APIC|nr:hypothetical protein C922_02043 [Plasmodium inui San Antonio 1]EUD67337.1 hypothetical protein C922_02043 [Plasmodium inui San Antonio 1]